MQIPLDSYPTPGQPTAPYENRGEGTIRIAGKTDASKAAVVALGRWNRGLHVIEFFFLGANAGHVALKAAMRLIHLLWAHHRIAAAIVPREALTETPDPEKPGATKTRVGCVLRVVPVPAPEIHTQ